MTDNGHVEFDLQDVVTVPEALEIVDKKAPNELIGKGRIADRYKIPRMFVGRGTTVFPLARVAEVGRLLTLNPMRGGPLPDEIAKEELEEYQRRLNRVRAKIRRSRRGPISQYYTRQEACKKLGITPQRLYVLSDWHGGPLHTVKVGRTRIWLKEDVDYRATSV